MDIGVVASMLALSVILTVTSGQSSALKQVLAMPGVEHISVNALATPALAEMAVDPTVNKIAPMTGAANAVAAAAKS